MHNLGISDLLFVYMTDDEDNGNVSMMMLAFFTPYQSAFLPLYLHRRLHFDIKLIAGPFHCVLFNIYCALCRVNAGTLLCVDFECVKAWVEKWCV